MMQVKLIKVFILLTLSIVAISCKSTIEMPQSHRSINMPNYSIKTFASGQTLLSNKYNSEIEEDTAYKLFKNKKYFEMSKFIGENIRSNEVSYWLLGEAAYNLGYVRAALNYYKMALYLMPDSERKQKKTMRCELWGTDKHSEKNIFSSSDANFCSDLNLASRIINLDAELIQNPCSSDLNMLKIQTVSNGEIFINGTLYGVGEGFVPPCIVWNETKLSINYKDDTIYDHVIDFNSFKDGLLDTRNSSGFNMDLVRKLDNRDLNDKYQADEKKADDYYDFFLLNVKKTSVKNFVKYFEQYANKVDKLNFLSDDYLAKYRNIQDNTKKKILASYQKSLENTTEPRELYTLGGLAIPTIIPSELKIGKYYGGKEKKNIRTHFTTPTFDESLINNEKYQLFIFFDNLNKNRFVNSERSVDSKYISYYTEPNADYYELERMLLNLQNRFEQASRDNKYKADRNFGEALSAMASGMEARELDRQVNNVNQKLAQTPMTIRKEVYSPYKHKVANISVEKSVKYRLFLINGHKDIINLHEGVVNDNKYFRIGYSVRDDDYSKVQYDSESDVQQYLEQDLNLHEKNLYENLAKKPTSKFFTKSKQSIVEFINSTKSERRNNFDHSKEFLVDERNTSVVVIKSTKGSLGTGFYITKNKILTNLHVIDSSLVSITNVNGKTSKGSLVASDRDKDLAIIETNIEGIPVKFYKEDTIRAGSTVEAIGHPQGLEYSITRGIVSAIRPMNANENSTNLYTYIQTDTPISPGNSGGPLFLGNEVIGINTFKNIQKSSENLNFSLHFSEIIEFLSNNGL